MKPAKIVKVKKLEFIKMKTLKEKEARLKLSYENKKINLFYAKDVKEHLNAFYESYWKHGKEGDKGKLWISCDQLDYLLDKQFGKLVDIKTLQLLESDEISKDKLYKITLKEEK